jgi:hypothetical protein
MGRSGVEGWCEKKGMNNLVSPFSGTRATTAQQGAKFFVLFLNRIEHAEISKGIDYEG